MPVWLPDCLSLCLSVFNKVRCITWHESSDLSWYITPSRVAGPQLPVIIFPPTVDTIINEHSTRSRIPRGDGHGFWDTVVTGHYLHVEEYTYCRENLGSAWTDTKKEGTDKKISSICTQTFEMAEFSKKYNYLHQALLQLSGCYYFATRRLPTPHPSHRPSSRRRPHWAQRKCGNLQLLLQWRLWGNALTCSDKLMQTNETHSAFGNAHLIWALSLALVCTTPV